jgi:hypothetical protein
MFFSDGAIKIFGSRSDFGGSVEKGKQTMFYFRPGMNFTFNPWVEASAGGL